jgi:hypothetical protein
MELVDEFCDLGAHHCQDMPSSSSGEGVNGSTRNHDERPRINFARVEPPVPDNEVGHGSILAKQDEPSASDIAILRALVGRVRLEVGEHEDVEEFGAASGTEGVQAFPEAAFQLVRSHGRRLRRRTAGGRGSLAPFSAST